MYSSSIPPPSMAEKMGMSESIVAEPDIFVDNAEEDNFDNIVPSVPDPAPNKKKRRPPPALIPIEEVAEVRCLKFFFNYLFFGSF